MNDRFEVTFTVDLTPQDAWRAIARRDLADPMQTRADEPASGQVWLPGWESTAEVLQAAPDRTLRVRKDRQPCKGTEILITLEAAGTGTRVTVVQSGFGAAFDVMLNWLAVGWELIVCDLILYLERGVIAGRFSGAWGRSLGFTFAEAPSGLVVRDVEPAGWAASVGLAPTDHLITLAQVPVTTTRDFAMVARALAPGSEVACTWLRGSEPMEGGAQL